MATRVQLHAQKRDLLGKKVRRLRQAGRLPATVYGQHRDAQSIQIEAHELRDVLRQAGRTQLIDLIIDGAPARPVLIRQTAVDAKRNVIMHVEFFQANLREKLQTHVPLHFVGDSQAVRDGGVALHIMDHVDIESLPQDVPAGGVEVDMSQITEINGAIHAGDLRLPDGISLVTSPDEVVAKVTPPVSEEAVEEILAEPAALPQELGGDEQQPDAVPEA